MNNDGVSLTNRAHPKPSLWRRFVFGFSYYILRRHRLNDAALETIEIEINPRESINDRQK